MLLQYFNGYQRRKRSVKRRNDEMLQHQFIIEIVPGIRGFCGIGLSVVQRKAERPHKVRRHATIHYTGGKPWDLFTVQFGAWWRVYERLPREIREEWTPDPEVYRLWRSYRIPPVRWVVDGVRNLKQRLG